jgi:hypothetical protein
MVPIESALTRRWIERHGADYDLIEFNVRLGEGIDPGADVGDSTRRLAQMVSTRRADIIATRGLFVTIVEVKERAGLSAMGQVQGYGALWEDEYPNRDKPELVVVAKDTGPDVDAVLRSFGIKLELYPDVNPPQPAPAA